MARLYLDHNVHADVATLLRTRGHDAVTARDRGHERLPDHDQLLYAAGAERSLVSHDTGFVDLHGAWLAWSRAWGAAARHQGILIIPQWQADRAALELDAFLRTGWALTDLLVRWFPRDGWCRRVGQRWEPVGGR